MAEQLINLWRDMKKNKLKYNKGMDDMFSFNNIFMMINIFVITLALIAPSKQG